MPTLAQLIAIHEAAQPAPITLSPLAEARVAARRLARAAAVLDSEDRLEVLTLAMREIIRLTEDAPHTA
jgi:hypothetical protein